MLDRDVVGRLVEVANGQRKRSFICSSTDIEKSTNRDVLSICIVIVISGN